VPLTEHFGLVGPGDTRFQPPLIDGG
jgi:hypothetical protein